jgi:superfamily I DNA/RNA helicase/Zn-dependent peptidase ImmA (M78 family)
VTNPLELIRRRAAALHAASVAEGADPSAPLRIARGAALVYDLEVSARPKGHPNLCGGRAVYDRDAGTIEHEATGDPFQDAFLIAHEIGHHEFGGDLGIVVTTAVDPEGSATGGDLGSARVVDYSPASRVETRMNLFAREFLLPRDLLRRWHVEEGCSASEIAERTGAPYGAVALQLFDALLLPPIELPDASPAPRPPLDAEQRLAVRHRGGAFLLRAGPGTGKTQTLVGRLESLHGEGVDPEGVLVLTFSNKAATELTERIAATWPEAAASAWIGTFHSFGLDLLRRCGRAFGLPENPRLIDQVEAVAMLEDELVRLDLEHFRDLWDPTDNLRDILQAISRAKDEVVDAPAYRKLAEAMIASATGDEARERAARCLEVAKVYDCYERLKRERECLDFGDLVAQPVVLLETREVIRREQAAQYAHILVDEYQDVNRASVRLLRALAPTGENLWAVGDAKQSIYRFRGASSANMTQFAQTDFPGGAEASLRMNYRSHKEICDAFAAFAGTMTSAEPDFEARAHQGAGGGVAFVPVRSKEHEVEELALRISAAREAGIAYRDQAVICRGNERLGEIARGLEARSIPILYLGPLFDRPEVKEALALLSLLDDPLAIGLVAAANLPEISIPLDDVARCIRALREAAPDDALDWTAHLLALDTLSDRGRAGVAALVEILEGLEGDHHPWWALARIYLDKTRMGVRLAAGLQGGEVAPAVALWQLQNFLRAVKLPAGRNPVAALLEHVRRLVLLADDRDLRALPAAAQAMDAVHILTIHASKGLEFEAVHMASLTARSLPQPTRKVQGPPPDGMIEGPLHSGIEAHAAGHAAEEECLFFVGLSRARRTLTLLAKCNERANGLTGQSPFIEKLGPSARAEAALSSPPAELDPPSDASLDWRGPPTFTAAQLRQFERCKRHFFFAHVLDLPGRRRVTAFTQMHDAVRVAVAEGFGVPFDGVDAQALERRFERAWAAHGPTDHAYAMIYRDIGRRLFDAYLHMSAAESYDETSPRSIEIGGIRIEVQPNEQVATGPHGARVRFVRTGRMIKAQLESLEAAAVQLIYSGPGEAEYLFLTDQRAEPVVMTPRQLENRRAKIERAADDILHGRFPAAPDRPNRACPRCPYFFICTDVPQGLLTIG